MAIQVLVVDDDAAIRSALRRGLETTGYVISEAGSKAELMQRLDQQPPVDLITLDLTLGSEDGLVLARHVRSKRNVPIIMITARTQPIDRLTGLEHGADDYIVKPFLIREVLLRIRSVLRRYELEGKSGAEAHDADVEHYQCELGRVDVARRRLITTDGNVSELTDAEFDILVLFLRNPGRVLSRDDLAMLLRGRRWSPMDRTLDGHIARLRKKIEPRLESPSYIKTVWRVGYVFVGDVKRL